MIDTNELINLSGIKRTTVRNLVAAGVLRPAHLACAGGGGGDQFSLAESLIAAHLAALPRIQSRPALKEIAVFLRRFVAEDATKSRDDLLCIFGREVQRDARSRARRVLEFWQRKQAAEKREERKSNRPIRHNTLSAETQAAG